MAGRLNGKICRLSVAGRAAAAWPHPSFAREGAAVGIVDLPHSRGEPWPARLRDEGYSAAFAPADVSDEAQVSQAVETISGALGAITVLFNHAGTIVIRPFLNLRWRTGTG